RGSTIPNGCASSAGSMTVRGASPLTVPARLRRADHLSHVERNEAPCCPEAAAQLDMRAVGLNPEGLRLADPPAGLVDKCEVPLLVHGGSDVIAEAQAQPSPQIRPGTVRGDHADLIPRHAGGGIDLSRRSAESVGWIPVGTHEAAES